MDDDEAYGDFENLDGRRRRVLIEDDAPAADEDKPLEGREAIAAAKARAMAQKAEEEEDEDDFAADARQALRDRAAKTDSVFADDEERLALEGHRAGLYVRVLLEDVPRSFFDERDPSRPIILGGFCPTVRRPLLTARVRRHRWPRQVSKRGIPSMFSDCSLSSSAVVFAGG